MAADFPQLTSFGTLLKFALSLEETARELAGLAAEREECAAWRSELAGCAKRHSKRGQQLERLRRERLNEVVLQPITGMNHTEYMPPVELPTGADAEQIIARVADVEQSAARFYDDAAVMAANVLAGVERTFKKLAQESKSLASALAARED